MNKYPVIIILGGNGMLGQNLQKSLRVKHPNCEIRSFDLPEWDITRQQDREQLIHENTVVINCAAYTKVDLAESEPDTCFAVNAEAVGELSRIAARRHARMVHISTDFVFDGKGDSPLSEASPTAPLSVYGASKLAGEQNLLASACRGSILRIQWTYGANGQNFVGKIIEAARKNDQLRVVDDQIGSPTWTGDVANAIIALIDHDADGIWHFAAEGYASRYQVAKFILKEKQIDAPVIPCRSDDFDTPAIRPLNSRFDCSKIDRILPSPRQHWDCALQRFLHQ